MSPYRRRWTPRLLAMLAALTLTGSMLAGIHAEAAPEQPPAVLTCDGAAKADA